VGPRATQQRCKDLYPRQGSSAELVTALRELLAYIYLERNGTIL